MTTTGNPATSVDPNTSTSSTAAAAGEEKQQQVQQQQPDYGYGEHLALGLASAPPKQPLQPPQQVKRRGGGNASPPPPPRHPSWGRARRRVKKKKKGGRGGGANRRRSSSSSSSGGDPSSSEEDTGTRRSSKFRRPRSSSTASAGGGGGSSTSSSLPSLVTSMIRSVRSSDEATFVAREFGVTALYAVAACLLRGILALTVAFAAKGGGVDGAGAADVIEPGSDGVMRLIKSEMIGCLSSLSRWCLRWLPRGGNSPGLVFASGWLLFPLRDRFGLIPNVPVRICEMVLGRLTPRDLALVLPFHFLAAVLGALVVRVLLAPVHAIVMGGASSSSSSSSPALESFALEPIVYSEANAWTVDFTREVLVNAAYVVSILVLPELLRLNSIPRWVASLAVMPLFAVSVDHGGLPSSFSPDVLYALRCVSRHEEVPLGQSSHLFGPIVGGLLGGRVMSIFFPDPQAQDR